ncbi:Cobyric acid synthase [Candidatus Hepatincola sp. Pdp]
MILGSASNVGKSLITAGLGRVFTKDGFSVAPFKSINFTLNAYVDNHGKEIGYAQYLQADMIGIPSKNYMQPILVKYKKNNPPQVIIAGKIVNHTCLQDHEFIKQTILNNYQKIKNNYTFGLVEGMGSCIELNLTQTELSNINLAKLLKAPALLITDIEKGGVFAQIYGTIMLLQKEDRSLIKGIIINKFHGDKKILQAGLNILKQKLLSHNISIPVLGIIPYSNLKLPEEDILALPNLKLQLQDINIAVVLFPHLANFTDFKVFEYYENVNLYYAKNPKDLDYADVIILAGSKETLQDLEYLHQNGFSKRIQQAINKGVIIFGVCAGLQMLGKNLQTGNYNIQGLGLLDINTVFKNSKTTKQIKAIIHNFNNELASLNNYEISGYEIHNGESISTETSFLHSNKPIGYYKNNIYATYLHDIFYNSNFTASFLNMIRKKKGLTINKGYYNINYKILKLQEYDKWEHILRNNLNIKQIYQIINNPLL